MKKKSKTISLQISSKIRRATLQTFDTFEVEMKPLVDAFEDLFHIQNGQHPKLMKEFLGGRVSLETMIILDELVTFGPDWNRKLEDDIIWNDLDNLMDNYERFLTIDQERYKIILLKLIEESTDNGSSRRVL
jgi:hypothetical protein